MRTRDRNRFHQSVLKLLSATIFLAAAPAQAVCGAQAAPGTGATPPVEPRSEEALRDEQLAVSGRYQRFERMLSQMADLLAKEDPEKADLLRRAIGKGREEAIGDRIENIVELMESKEFGTAIEKQQEVSQSLLTMLKLLQSEDRRSSVERERERLNQILNDVRNLISGQRSTRAATQNAQSPSNTAPSQQKNIKEAEKLIEGIQDHDRESAENSETPESEQGEGDSTKPNGLKPPEGENPKNGKPSGESPEGPPEAANPSDPKSGDPKSGEPKSAPGEKTPDEQKPGEKTPGDKAPGENAPQPQEGGQQGEKKNQQTPGRKQIQDARKLMQQALDALKQQNREKAVENQDESIRELHEAAAELEKMLQQLREEEKEMLLAALEARFQRMLTLQTQIHEGTVELGTTPQEQWPEQYYLRARELSQQQTDLTSECAQTSGLLREDGTSVSILIAVEDIERDMNTVSGLLRENKVTGLTQSMQLDVIEAIKELIEATQKEMEEMKSEERQQQQQQEGPQEKPPLVELKAEIQMLRSLQLRVNRRTQQIDQLLQNTPESDRDALLAQIQELARRQQRLIQSAKELAKQAQQ
ncbi:MAG: hypothetical protein JNL58_29705 [Planctomyces sp.]|nr:hypothetical protein [Planctomyces sp.]